MKKNLLAVLAVVIISIPLVASAGSEWYENGTLHHSTVAVWKKATYANKLATAADWLINIPKMKARVLNSRDINTLRPFASELVSCINEASAGQGYDSMLISDVAAGCVTLMGWMK